MTAPHTPGLADLARALTDRFPVTTRMGTGHLMIFVPVCPGGFTDRIAVHEDGKITTNGGMTHAVIDVLAFIKSWQAPPRPDAAAFVQAVQAYEDACRTVAGMHAWDDLGTTLISDEQRKEVYARHKSAKAALLAFGPSDAGRITEEMIERCARALYDQYADLAPWEKIPQDIQHDFRGMAKHALEAALNGRRGGGWGEGALGRAL